ncbi:site-specific integrase [Agrobacterium tumefaciens]|uniref:site-specific integrase n=2 Tax=Rhizobiaceae TaxID=82115 RepID=UPI002350BA2F
MDLVPVTSLTIIEAAGDKARFRILEFFTAQIRNINTRRSYTKATMEFLTWCEERGARSLVSITPIHVAAWIEELTGTHSVPTVKQRLAAVRHLFDWLVTGQVMPTNPAHSVRGPKHSRRRGKTPVLSPEEARQLLDSIPTDTPIGKRDRALIGLMTYTFARIGAATGMEVRDVYAQNRRLWVRLHEKGGKQAELPCHHSLEAYLDDFWTGTVCVTLPVHRCFKR